MIKSLRNAAQNLSILIVEDDDQTRELLEELLKNFFKTVMSAANGEEGLSIYTQSPTSFDIILTDITMPVMDGLAMTEKIREIDPRQMIVVLSAHQDSTNLFRAIELMVEYFIPKPINDKKLFGILLRMAERVHRRNELIRMQAMQQMTQLQKALDISWQLVADALPFAGFVADLNGRICAYNKQFSLLFNYATDSMAIRELEEGTLTISTLFSCEGETLCEMMSPLDEDYAVRSLGIGDKSEVKVYTSRIKTSDDEIYISYCLMPNV